GALICVGLVASISSMTWIGPRVAMTMGEDLPLFRFLARKTANGVPAVANILITTNSFQKVIDYIQFSLTACSFFTVLGVFVLRARQPDLPRPYRTWGYPLTPLIFLAVSAWMMVFMLRAEQSRAPSLVGLGTILLGLILYFVSQKKSNAAASPSLS